jgi:hypothetical protein
MNRAFQSVIVWSLVAASGFLPVDSAWAEDTVSTARDLYAAASYEDALTVLNRLRARDRSADDNRTIEQYRAFCLLALGRVNEADQAIEGIVIAEPMYFPSAAEVSPRVRSAFTDVRRRMLPSFVQQKYTQAKAAFDRRDLPAAEAGFKQILDVLADPALSASANQPPLSDLRTLTVGFLELTVAAAAPPPPPAPPPPATPDPPVVAPVPLTAPAPAVPEIYTVGDANVVAPVVINQALPQYKRDGFPSTPGVLEIVISKRGEVESAAMRMSVKPTYDGLVLAAVRGWRYKPATVDGVPVRFRKLIQITLDRDH